MTDKIQRRNKIKMSIRKKVSGTAARPRLTVFRSNKQIYAQIVDDTYAHKFEVKHNGVSEGEITVFSSKTLCSASSLSLGDTGKITKKEQAAKVGELIAKNAVAAGITEVVFDRNGYLYHGRVQELADAARKGGLKF
ncbi:MAG: 50S ribosomal protein L18 [Paludibacteraceae bacterium]|jgi:large subunit ribosomal protein L18|nr:50S ribosomal protein L18 [Paludibacteraceae bacterium]MBR6104416.1 50S ribosomal protein L18 [Paludibacteraceae bacterium]